MTGAAPLVAVGGVLHVKLTFMETSGSDKLYATANSAVTEAIASIRVIQVGCGRPTDPWSFVSLQLWS